MTRARCHRCKSPLGPSSRYIGRCVRCLMNDKRADLARIEASGHDRETGRDREATKAGSAPNPTQQIGN